MNMDQPSLYIPGCRADNQQLPRREDILVVTLGDGKEFPRKKEIVKCREIYTARRIFLTV